MNSWRRPSFVLSDVITRWNYLGVEAVLNLALYVKILKRNLNAKFFPIEWSLVIEVLIRNIWHHLERVEGDVLLLLLLRRYLGNELVIVLRTLQNVFLIIALRTFLFIFFIISLWMKQIITLTRTRTFILWGAGLPSLLKCIFVFFFHTA